MEWDYVCETRLLTDTLSIPQMICEWIWGSGGIYWQGKPKNSERDLSRCRFVHHKSHMDYLDAKPDLRGEKPATNSLSYGTAEIFHISVYYLSVLSTCLLMELFF
jgi:hypothetical protein